MLLVCSLTSASRLQYSLEAGTYFSRRTTISGTVIAACHFLVALLAVLGVNRKLIVGHARRSLSLQVRTSNYCLFLFFSCPFLNDDCWCCRTSYSSVTQSRSYLPDEVGALLWVSQYKPSMSTFIPIYVGAEEVKLATKFPIGTRDSLSSIRKFESCCRSTHQTNLSVAKPCANQHL